MQHAATINLRPPPVAARLLALSCAWLLGSAVGPCPERACWLASSTLAPAITRAQPPVKVRELNLEKPSKLRVYTPNAHFELRTGLGLVYGLSTGSGAWATGSLERVVLHEAGPGRLLLGGQAQLGHANGTVVTTMLTTSYILDLDDKLRPWLQLGFGMLWTPARVMEPANVGVQPTVRGDVKTRAGLGLCTNLGMDVDLGPDWYVSGALGLNFTADTHGALWLGGGIRM